MSQPPQVRLLWRFTTLIVIFQLMVVQAMAASGALHKRFHDHCDEPGHECAVTLVLHGGYHSEIPDIVPVDVVSEPPQVAVVDPVAVDIVPGHLAGGVLAHAPPRGP